MNQKNKNLKKRTFIPQPIGHTLKKINRNFTSKFGKIEFIINSKWSEIAGSYFFEYSEPKNIVKFPDIENELGEKVYKNYLNVSVAPAAAVEFQHYKNTIIDKINSHFGYRAIIDLRIQQNYIPRYKNFKGSEMNNTKLSDKQEQKISEQVEDMRNQDLKDSLIDLGKNITKGTKQS